MNFAIILAISVGVTFVANQLLIIVLNIVYLFAVFIVSI